MFTAARVPRALLISVVLVSPALGQVAEAPPGEPADPDPSEAAQTLKPEERLRFHEIVYVTAEKRKEDLRVVPISLAAFTSDQIEEAGIEKPGDFFGLIPNLFFADTFTVGSSLVMSRGVAQTHNGSSPMAIVVDGAYQGNQKQLNQELFDVERIEVLKGPQGALYGRNSIGGAVNIVTQQPTESFEGYARGSVGNGASLGAAVVVSGPLHEDDLLYRFSGSYKESDGLIDNIYLDTESDPYDDTTGRFQLLWRARSRLAVNFRVSTSETNGGAASYSIFPTTGYTNDFSFPPESNILGFSRRDMDDYSVRAEWTGTAFSFTSITDYARVGESYRADADFSYPGGRIAAPFGQLGQGQDLDVAMLSQELRFASPDEQRLRWVAGAYLLETDRELVSQLSSDTDGTIGGFVPIVRLAEHDDNLAWAFFGQTDFKWNERWTFSASARYDKDQRDQTDLVTGGFRKTSFDAWQPRLTASYQRSPKLMAYLNAGTGFRSGGFNAPTVNPEIFEKEISKNLELGIRSSLLDDRLRIDGAVYATRLDDAQFFRLDFASASQIIDNMNEVEVRGVELSVTSRPVQGLEVYASYGYNDSEIADYDGTGIYDGNQTPANVRSMLNLGAQYSHLIGRSAAGTFRADFGRRGEQYWTPDNIDVQDPVSLVNLRFTLTTKLWAVGAWIKNATDEKYYVEYGDAAWAGIISGDDIAQLGRPRSYGLDLTRRF